MGQYEPEDSRNITGTASTPDGRWTNKEGKPPAGVPDDKPADAEEAASASDQTKHGEQPALKNDPHVPEHNSRSNER